MLSYLSAETGFIKSYSNKTLLIIFLCALTRTAEKPTGASAFGLTVSLNPGIITVFGPLLVLLLLIGLSMESDVLLVAREAILDEASKISSRARRVGRAVYLLFWTPSVACGFFIIEYYNNVVPSDPIACNYDRTQQFVGFSHWTGTPSLYCIRNLTEGMPWIYPPFQIYGELVVLFGCVFVTSRIAKNWSRMRGASFRATVR